MNATVVVSYVRISLMQFNGVHKNVLKSIGVPDMQDVRVLTIGWLVQCFFFFPWQILVPVAILKKVPVAEQECAWQYSKIAQNARASAKLGKIARGKFEKSARAPPKNARGKL